MASSAMRWAAKFLRWFSPQHRQPWLEQGPLLVASGTINIFQRWTSLVQSGPSSPQYQSRHRMSVSHLLILLWNRNCSSSICPKALPAYRPAEAARPRTKAPPGQLTAGAVCGHRARSCPKSCLKAKFATPSHYEPAAAEEADAGRPAQSSELCGKLCKLPRLSAAIHTASRLLRNTEVHLWSARLDE